MLISEIVALGDSALAEDYTRKLWEVAQRKGPFFYTNFLRHHPLALDHLAKMREGFDAMGRSRGGDVYICTHPAFPGRIKIGSTRKNARDRVHGLRTAGVIGPYELESFVSHFDAFGLEARMHRYFKPMQAEREWFRATPAMGLAVLTRHQREDQYLRDALCDAQPKT